MESLVTPNMSSVLTTVASTVARTMTGMVNTTNHTLNALQNISTTAKTREITHAKEDGIMSQRRYFMHFIGGWLLTAIFLFGLLFLLVTHFLGRRQWRKYQQRLEEERSAVNHVLVDPKFMKYTNNGWREIAFSL